MPLRGVHECATHICTLLTAGMVPDPSLTAAEMQAAAAAIAASTGTCQHALVTYRCALQAPDAVVQIAARVACMCEVLLPVREASALCETAALSLAAAGTAAAQQLNMWGVAVAEEHLHWLMQLSGSLVGHNETGIFLCQSSALTLAAISAGPGSDLQRQLFSLLCTMVKLGSAPVGSMVAQSIADKSGTARINLLICCPHSSSAACSCPRKAPA